MGAGARGEGGRRDRPGRRAMLWRRSPAFPDRPRNDGKTRRREAAAGRRRSPAAVCRSARRRSRMDDVREVAGPAALQDDWAMTNAIEAGQGGEALRQLALMLDAGAPPEQILGQLGWLVRSKFPQVAPARAARRRRVAVPHGPRPEAVGRRSARAARAAGRRVVRRKADADRIRCAALVTRGPTLPAGGYARAATRRFSRDL